MIQVTQQTIAKHPFARANTVCNGCGAKGEEQGAAGSGCRDYALDLARLHSLVHGWKQSYERVKEGKKTYSLVRHWCPTCVAKQAS